MSDATRLFEKGELLFQEAKFEDALYLFDKAFETGLRSLELFYRRGACSNQQNWHLDAIDDFSKAIEIDPHDCNLWIQRGNSRRSCGDIDGALSDYDEGIKLSKTDRNKQTYDDVIKELGYESATDFYEFIRTFATSLDPCFLRELADEAKARGRRRDATEQDGET